MASRRFSAWRSRGPVLRPVAAEVLQTRHILQLGRNQKRLDPGRIPPPAPVGARSHRIHADPVQQRKRVVLVLRPEHRALAHQPVLNDFTPADTVMNLRKISVSAKLETERPAALDLAEHLALELGNRLERITPLPRRRKLRRQIDMVSHLPPPPDSRRPHRPAGKNQPTPRRPPPRSASSPDARERSGSP